MSKVALVAHRIADPAPSGIGRYYRELITALACEGRGTSLVAVTPREPGRPGWLPPEVARRTVPGPRQAVQFCWSAVRRPRIDAWTGGVDLVHALHTWAPVPTRLPLVVTVHDLMPVLNPSWFRRDHRWAARQALRYSVDHADRIVTSSTWVATLVKSECGVAADRIDVVPEGVNDRFRTAPTRNQVQAIEKRWGLVSGGYLLAVGQVTARKNLLTVVRALARLGPQRSRGLPLVIAGSPGPASAALDAEVARLGVGDRVRLLGYVADDLLAPLVAGAVVLVHPSLDEGFGLTPIEAMAAGTPVIASRAASLPEVIGDAGILIDAAAPGAGTGGGAGAGAGSGADAGTGAAAGGTEADAWAEAMERVIGDEDERRRLTEAGRIRQAAFTWAATARGTLAVYRDVLEGRRLPPDGPGRRSRDSPPSGPSGRPPSESSRRP